MLRDDNEIVAEIYNTKQGKNKTIFAYARRLKELVGKMESQPVDGLKKQWFVEGLRLALKKKMKIVPPALYTDAYNRVMDLESEQKKSKKKHKSSDLDNSSSESSSSDEESSKKVRVLQKDMLQMMKEFKNLKKNPNLVKGELWCTDYKEEGHTEGSCLKKQFCDICQVAGHSIKECPFNMKSNGHQKVLLMQEMFARTDTNNDATSGGYRNNNRHERGGNNNNNENGGRSRILYDASGQPMIQCCVCILWGHFAKDCTTKETSQLLCRWCGPRDHEDPKCLKQGINLLSIEACDEKVLAITCEQARKAKYPDAGEEKERLQQA